MQTVRNTSRLVAVPIRSTIKLLPTLNQQSPTKIILGDDDIRGSRLRKNHKTKGI